MPRINTTAPTPAAPRGDFVGREAEKREFGASVRLLLGQELLSSGARAYPHIFLISGEGGMGKSSLLRELRRVAGDEGMRSDQIVLLDFADSFYPTEETVAQALANMIEQGHHDGAQHYRTTVARRRELQPRYNTLLRQWQRWTSIRPESDDVQDICNALKRRASKREVQQAKMGLDTPAHVLIDLEDAYQELGELQSFFDEHQRAPQSFDELLSRKLGEHAELFRNNHSALGRALDQDLFELAERAPLLLLLDTYEQADAHDAWLRKTLLAQMSDRMLVVIAGRSQLEVTYRRQFDGALPGLVVSYDLDRRRLSEPEVGQYLQLRRNAEVAAELIAEAYRISRGIPLAVRALGDQLAAKGDFAPFRELADQPLDESGVVHQVVERFLSNLLDRRDDVPQERERKQRDRRRVRALALQRPNQPADEQMIACLWGLPPDETERALADLAKRYSFVFRGSLYRLHDLVHTFTRAQICAEQRRSADWPTLEEGLRRVLALVETRITQREAITPDRDERYADADWREALIDKLNALLWLSEDDAAMRLLLNRWIEARYANPPFAVQLRDLAVELQPRGPVWKRLLTALNDNDIGDERLGRYADKLDQHAHAVLYLLQAQAREVRAVQNESECKAITKNIELLIQGYALDSSWKPLGMALADLYSERAAYYWYQSRFDAALANYDQSLRLRPDNPSTLYNRGTTKSEMGDLVGALADYDQALRLRPDHPDTLTNRGLTKGKMGDLAGALADSDQSLKLRPDDPNTMYNIAYAHALLRDVTTSLDWLARAIAGDNKYRAMARTDADFDAIRDDPRFVALVGEG